MLFLMEGTKEVARLAVPPLHAGRLLFAICTSDFFQDIYLLPSRSLFHELCGGL